MCTEHPYITKYQLISTKYQYNVHTSLSRAVG